MTGLSVCLHVTWYPESVIQRDKYYQHHQADAVLWASLMDPHASKRVYQGDWEPQPRLIQGQDESRRVREQATSTQGSQEENRVFVHSPDSTLCVLNASVGKLCLFWGGNFLPSLPSTEVHPPPKLHVPWVFTPSQDSEKLFWKQINPMKI